MWPQNCTIERRCVVGWSGWSENWPRPSIGSFYAYPSKRNFHTKFHQNWTKIVEVSQSHVVGRGVGWLGWSNFFYRLISRVDHQDKPPYKISTQYLKAFRSYPIVKVSYQSGCRVGGQGGWSGLIFSIGSFSKIIKMRNLTKFQHNISRRLEVIQS